MGRWRIIAHCEETQLHNGFVTRSARREVHRVERFAPAETGDGVVGVERERRGRRRRGGHAPVLDVQHAAGRARAAAPQDAHGPARAVRAHRAAAAGHVARRGRERVATERAPPPHRVADITPYRT
ncbi:unnamed protein product [Colias eurytheme]|nr:unnamed protein product [Colias eurytheme]